MKVSDLLSPIFWRHAISLRFKRWQNERKLRSFISKCALEDRTNARLLAISIERPFDTRPKEVLDYLVASRQNTVSVKHSYFSNLDISFNLVDNFQMAICKEFFIDNVYDLSKLKFTPQHVIDCGGYQGYFTWLAMSRFLKANFICVEAHDKNYNDIVQTAQRNNLKVQVLHNAVSSRKGSVEFYFEGSSGNMGYTFKSESYKLVVPTVDLSELIIGKEDLLLKVDIEGAELEFFPEIIDQLPQRCAVFFETHDYWNSLKAIKEKFLQKGFLFEIIAEKGQFIDSFAQRS